MSHNSRLALLLKENGLRESDFPILIKERKHTFVVYEPTEISMYEDFIVVQRHYVFPNLKEIKE